MTMPVSVNDYLQERLFERRSPICISVNQSGHIVAVSGPTGSPLLSDAEIGAPIAELLPFIVGRPLDEIAVLPFISVADHVYEVHVLPDEESTNILLLDARREHDLLQQRQQTTNELRLLHANQNKLIQRMRDMIGDLVEARSELDHRRMEAEKSSENQGRFIAMMSHEFRTPLASIINYADLALDDDADQQTIRRSNEAIARASRHLTMLVDTILDDAKLEAGQFTLTNRNFSVLALIEDLSAIMAPLAAEKGLSFSASIENAVPEYVNGNDTGIRQVLINLLGNAVKYTEQGSVTLIVGWQDGYLNASVSDTGPGIPSDSQARMFQLFERGEQLQKNVPGAGLGLAICLQLAQLMGGEIVIDNQQETGCHLHLSIPAPLAISVDEDEKILPQMSSEHNADSPSIILLCDDDEDMLALAEYYMHQAGYGLLLARDGLEAVEKALAYDPDLILMDINTPRLNGADATNRLRKSGYDKPIVALTASDGRYFDQASFTAYLRKPVQMPALLQEVKSQLSAAVK